MAKQTDLFADILQRYRAATGASVDALAEVLDGVRLERGGAKVYLPKVPPERTAESKARRLGAALAQGLPLADAFAAAGCSQPSGYRLLRRRNRR